jgi:predicted RNase H-like nuclease (RuvC/YqgF family)
MRTAPSPSFLQSLTALERQLSKLETENKALERDAERFRRRQKLQQELDDIRKKVGPRVTLGGKQHEQPISSLSRLETPASNAWWPWDLPS